MKKLALLAVFVFACASARHDADVLMNADRQFAADSAARGAAAWVAWFAENAAKPGSDGKWVIGSKAVGEQMAPAFADPHFSLAWSPVRAEISRGGRLGYTWGRYVLNRKGGTHKGTYMTVWEKQKDGSWKVLFDTGDAD